MKKVCMCLILLSWTVTAMPPHPRHRGPATCIIGQPRHEPKNLQNTTIETVAILVQFSDHLADTLERTAARYDSMFFSTGVYQGQYRAGSLNDFFLENSYGTTNVTGGIAGEAWHMSSHTYSYYYDGYYMLSSGYQMAMDAVALVDATVDFQQYDLDNDNHIDGVFIVHAGPGGEDTGDVNDCWSHAIPYFNYATNDGVIIDGATNVPEINLVTPSLDTTLCCIGVMCHELGHIVGLPDLYDGSRNTWGVGYWSLMGYGAWGAGGNTPWSPSHADSWCKTEVGWLTPTPITSNTYSLKIVDMETHPVAYRVWRNGAINDTFFILENRQNKGFDTPLPGQGLLIWHIDPRYNSWHNVVDLEEADGCDDLDNGWGYRPDPHYYHHELGDPGDPFPGDSNTTVFDSLSYPSSRDNWNHNTDVTVKNITLAGDTVICDIIIDPTGISEYTGTQVQPLIDISPNPFTHRVLIRVNTDEIHSAKMYDITGKLVAVLDGTHVGSSSVFQWNNDAKLTSGIYWFVCEAAGSTLKGKLILLR